jgi:hypothetical protein
MWFRNRLLRYLVGIPIAIMVRLYFRGAFGSPDLQPGQPGQVATGAGIPLDYIVIAGIAVLTLLVCVGLWYFSGQPKKPQSPADEFMNDPWVQANASKFSNALSEPLVRPNNDAKGAR